MAEQEVESEPEDSPYWVKSVGRALDVLDYLASEAGRGGVSVTEVSNALKLSKSAVFATLFTLTSRGFVQDEGTGMSRRYRLGMTLSRLGAIASGTTSLRVVAKPHLEELAREVGATARLAFLSGGHAVVVEQATGNERVRLDLQLGSAEDLHTTSLGKAILAQMPKERARAIIEEVGLERHTSKTITDVDEFLGHLAQVKEQGYAVNDEEDAEGVFGVAAAVFGADGICLGAVTITGLISQQPSGWYYDDMAREVARAAQAISADMGYVA